MCVCSLSYPERKGHAANYVVICGLSGSFIFFSHHPTNDKIFAKHSEYKFVLIFSKTFVSDFSHSNTN